MKKLLLISCIVCLFLVLLLIHSAYYYPFLSDDSLISLRYSQRLLEGHGLTWTEGRAVEGYSNLLWVLWISFVGLLKIDLVDATRISGYLFTGLIVVCASYYYFKNYKLKKIILPLVVGLLFFVLNGTTAVWAIGGLEQCLLAFLLALSIIYFYQYHNSLEKNSNLLIISSLFLGLICITRPDGPLFTVLFAAAHLHLMRWKNFIQNTLIIALIPALITISQLIFRLYYYGEWVPNTALVKISPTSHYFINGVFYWLHGNFTNFSFFIVSFLPIFFIAARRKFNNKNILLLLIFVVWSSYIVFIGGDIFPAFRHFTPLIVLALFGTIESLLVLQYSLFNFFKKFRFIALSISISLIAFYLFIQFNDGAYKRATSERWEWEGKEMAIALKTAFEKHDPLIAVTAAGCLPYWTNFRSLDMLGLNDYHIPRKNRDKIGNGFIGHELSDVDYLLESKPDLIVFNIGSKTDFNYKNTLDNNPIFKKNYVPHLLLIKNLENKRINYFSKFSEKIGLKSNKEKIAIPAYVFDGIDSYSFLNKKKELLTAIHPNSTIEFEFNKSLPKIDKVIANKTQKGKIEYKIIRDYNSTKLQLISKSDQPIVMKNVILYKY